MSYPDLLDSEWNAIEQIKGRSSELEASLSTTLATNKAKYQSFGETFKCLFTVSDLRESSTASSRRSIHNSPRLGLYGMTYDLWEVDWKLAGTLDAFRWPSVKPMSSMDVVTGLQNRIVILHLETWLPVSIPQHQVLSIL